MQITASANGGGSLSTGKGDSLAANVSTSPTSGSSSSPSASGDCSDTPPSGTYTCQQQVRMARAFLICGSDYLWFLGVRWHEKEACEYRCGGRRSKVRKNGQISVV